MNERDIAEQAFNNGYEKGYADAMRYATEQVKQISQEVKQIKEAVQNICAHIPEPPKGE